MKMLAIISLVLGICGLAAGLYCQYEVLPRGMDHEHPDYDKLRSLFIQRNDLKFNLGTTAMVAGGLSLLGGSFAGIKKAKLSWLAAAVSLPAMILGLLQATHLFS